MLRFEKWQVILIVLVSILGPLFALPNVLNESQQAWVQENLPGWFPNRAMSLGLDLQGGSHLQLQVDTATVINDRLEAMVVAARSALKQQKIAFDRIGLKNKQGAIVLNDEADADKAKSALQKELGDG